MKLSVVWAFSFVVIGACKAPPSDPATLVSIPKTIEEVRGKTKVERDNYRKWTTVIGPSFQVGAGFNPDPTTTFFLRGTVTEGRVTLQVYVEIRRYNWWFLDNANDSKGRRFETTVISRDTFTERHSVFCVEHVGVNLDMPYLESAAVSGVDLRVYGKGNHLDIYLPAYYCRGFLETLKDVLNDRQRKDP